MKENGNLAIYKEPLVNYYLNGNSGRGFMNSKREDVSYRIADLINFGKQPESLDDLTIDWKVTFFYELGSEKVMSMRDSRLYL